LIDGALAALEATSLAQHLRVSRWGYAAVNAGHILGIALLVGSATPLALRLLGAWPGIDWTVAVRLLRPVALVGLILAVATGLALFAIQARSYADLSVFQVKIALIVVGTLSALWAGRSARPRKAHGALSLFSWLGALVCGRLIAFVT
jgi:hypothetical protein